MPKKPQRKFKPYMSKAAVIRPAIEKALAEEFHAFHAGYMADIATKAAVKALRDYDRWLQRRED